MCDCGMYLWEYHNGRCVADPSCTDGGVVKDAAKDDLGTNHFVFVKPDTLAKKKKKNRRGFDSRQSALFDAKRKNGGSNT